MVQARNTWKSRRGKVLEKMRKGTVPQLSCSSPQAQAQTGTLSRWRWYDARVLPADPDEACGRLSHQLSCRGFTGRRRACRVRQADSGSQASRQRRPASQRSGLAMATWAVAPGGVGAGGRLAWRRGGRPEDLRSCAWVVAAWRRRAPRDVRRLAVCGSGVGVSASGSPRRGGGWTRVATSD
jgi:hypothetical protein